MTLLALQSVAKSFGGVRALDGVDLACEAARVHALLGENGAGKSTLIKILTGALVPDAGTIIMDGEPAAFTKPADATKRGIAAVYQEPLIYPHLSVIENLFMNQELTDRFGRGDRGRMRARAAPFLEQLEIEPAILDKPMSSLSIGYQQMMLIAQALLQRARLIIFDEPTSILSQDETRRLFAIIGDLRDAGTAVVYITHRLSEIPRIADDVTVLRNGAVVGSDIAENVSQPQLLSMMAGERQTAEPDTAETGPSPASRGRARLQVQDVSVPGASKNVNWTLSAGCVTGIYGLVGSGRSETALAAFGHLPMASGRVLLDGEAIHPKHPRDSVALGLAYLPEDRQLQGLFGIDKSVENNLTSNVLGANTRFPGRLNLAGLRRTARKVLQTYNIKAPGIDTPITALSGGNQQKALFARWAHLDLKVLILDEPTRGIDVGTKAEIHRFVRELAAAGAAVAVISSDLDEVLTVSDEVIVMRQGEVINRFEGQSMAAEPILSAAIGGGLTAARASAPATA